MHRAALYEAADALLLTASRWGAGKKHSTPEDGYRILGRDHYALGREGNQDRVCC